jgi:hypothetical protein
VWKAGEDSACMLASWDRRIAERVTAAENRKSKVWMKVSVTSPRFSPTAVYPPCLFRAWRRFSAGRHGG